MVLGGDDSGRNSGFIPSSLPMPYENPSFFEITKPKTPSFLLVNIGEAALTTITPIKIIGHEDISTALKVKALLSQPLNLPKIINPIGLQHSELDILLFVLDLPRLGVGLLLALLEVTTEVLFTSLSRETTL